MADDALAPTDNPFDQLDPDKVGTIAPPKEEPAPISKLNMGAAPAAGNDNQEKNPFDEFGEVGQTTSTAKGAFARGAERGVVPAATGLVGAGLGGAGVVAAGAAAGTTIGPWGTVAGGIAGALAGGYLGSAAQDWALKKLPDSWVDALGMDDRQQRLDESQHPTSSFLGGILPYAVTMRPSLSFAAAKLPENATALQKIMANPVTARLFGGGVNGGMELGQEAVHGDVDWSHVAISTVFGVVFNTPTKLGQALTNLGERPFRPATVAQAGDVKVMGPGVTEAVFHGTHEQAPDAAMTAQEAARAEHAALGEAAEPDVHAVAKQMHPELFDRYDDLLKRRDILSAWHGEGGGAEAAERHLAATNAELHEIAPEVSAAYRRAAETTGIETVEPEPFPSFAAMLAAHEHGGGNVEARAVPEVPTEPALGEAAAVPGVPGVPAGGEAPAGTGGQAGAAAAVVPAPQRSLGEQKAFIADDVAQKLIAAGRPEDEARAAGQVVAARYATRAGRFEGKLGTAEELYRKEGAAIAGPNGKVIGEYQAAGRAASSAQNPTFKTAKGSSYEVHPDGTTTRNKAARADVGHEGDFGPKPRSAKTIYLDTPEMAGNLTAAGLQGLGPKGARVIIRDGKASLLTWNEAAGKWGIAPGQRDIPFSTEPAVGRAPLEVWKPATDVPGYEAYRGMHAGNPITEMTGGTAEPAKVAEAAATPPIKPGVVANDFDTADRVKGEWRKASPYKETEPFIQASWHNQRALGEAADGIAKDLGVEFKNPGIKAQTTEDIASIKDEAKRAKAEAGRRRLESKAQKHGIGGVTDQVRGGFDVKTPEQADQIIAKLGEKFQITDEGWQTTPSGYFDRKAYIRFPDGMIGEVQFWPPGMFDAKEHGGGHLLYKGVRELPPWHPLIPEFHQASAQLYDRARAALSGEWKAVLGNSGNEPNLLPNAAGESTTPLRPTSAALTSDHFPPESTQASEGVQKNGSPSNEPAFNLFSMLGSPHENVGQESAFGNHAAPVRAALESADKINELTPSQQKKELPKYSVDNVSHPQGVDQPAGVFMFDPTALNVDAKRFQFKSGGDEYGVTGALRSVTKWDPAKAQSIIVWEQADGQLFVADGHQRAGLARRLTEKGGAKGIELPGVLYREKDGISADDIRAIAAVTNIANGSGSAIDGAKVLRARPDLMDGSLPLSAGKGKQAAALAKLGDEPFKMVLNEVIPEHYGAVVGDLIPNDPARQEAAIKAISRFEPKNETEAAVLTQRVAQAELAKREEGAQTSMFGDLETAESTAGEEMKIVGRAIADLKKDRSLFGRVLANAERIEQTGSHIQREAASGVATDAEIFAKTLASDAYTAGPIRDALVKAARDLKDGTATVGEASSRIVSALRAQAEENGLNRAGAVERGAETKEYAQSDQDLFEAGAEGKPQQLIPGVKPVSQRDLVQAAANKPMKPKVAQKAAGGLFGDSMDQKELFQKQGEPRIVSSKAMQEAVLRNEWGRNGRDLDFEDLWQTKAGNRLWEKEVDAWNAEHGTDFDYDQAYNNSPEFKDYFEQKYIAGKKTPFPGVKEANEAFEENGDYHLAAYLPGEVPKDLFQTARGKIRLTPNERPLITLMKDANPSTFMHESGHDFLEQMKRDAAHPDAPDVVKQDFEAAKQWMGVGEDGELQTKHHEKFARGFEQYLREGVAPSQGLARVFAQFRNWLLTIYQSIKGLGTEISPEIRGVFDRMLEMEPKRTVIAPEDRPTGGPALHEIHEGDAAHAEPHEAAALADRAAAERDRYIQEPPPEIANEIAATVQKVEAEQAARAGTEPGAEAGEGAGGQPEVDGGGIGPEPEPAGGGVGAGGGKVGEGRGGTETEGAAQPERRSKLGDSPGTALAPGPTDIFGASESPFTDRAGNIRLENLNTTEDVRQAIRDSAAENNDFIGDRRGVITDGQVIELADALGMDAGQIAKRQVGQAFNAEQIVAARKLLIESATQVSAAMKKAAIGTDEDVMAYAMAKDRHQMIQANVSGITAEAGRALRAFRRLPGQEAVAEVDKMLREATGKTLFQLKQEAKLGAALQTPQQVSKFMHEAGKASFGRMVLEMWINGILSGPATHMTNIIGNAILAVQHFGPESAIAAMVGRAQKAMGREGTYMRLGEIGAAAKGIKTGIAPAIEATGEALRRGTSTLLPGETARPLDVQPHDALAQKATLNEATTMGDVVHSAFSVFRGALDGMIAGGALIKAGGVEGSPIVGTRYSHLGAIPDIEVRGMNVLPVGTVIRAPGRFLAAADTFFRSTTYAMSKNAIAYRMASDEGLTGAAFDRRVAEIRTSSDDAVMEQARSSATEMTLMNRGGQFVQAMNHLTSATINLPLIGEIPPLKFINPFVNIAGQIINQSIVKRSPVGLLSPELRADLMGKNGNIAQDIATARMLMGTAVAVTLGGLAAGGYASGSGPKKPDEAAMWRLAGNQAHSVRIGDLWYDVSKLGPIGMLMGLAADMYEVGHKAHEGEYSEAAAYLHHAISQNILDQSFLKGPADLIQAIEDPERYGGRYVRNFLSSFIPYSNLLAQTARREDPYMRQTRTVLDAIKAKIPGMSETLFPRRDIWGEPMAQRQALGGTGVTGIYAQKMSADPVNKAMLDLGISPGAVDKKIRNVELTPQQYDDFARIAGRSTKMRLDAIVRSPDFQTWPPGTKHAVIEETVKQSREAARGIIMMKYPDLVHAAVEDRIARAKGEKKK